MEWSFLKEFKDSEKVYVGVIDESGNRHYLYEQEKGGEVKPIIEENK